MPMNTWDPGTMPMGGSQWSYPGVGGGFYDPTAGGDSNPEGAASDPFAYTGGSLLTPWQGRFNSQGYGGGYSVPAFTPFNYADFNYQAPSPGRFDEKYADPAAFRFADFQGPSAFKAPTAEDMQADPGYQARMDAVSKAQTAQAANRGTMRTGGFQKGLAQAVGDQASQEYGNVYNRRASEWDRNWGQAKDTYGINQGNTKSAFDTNTQNRLAGHNTRQNDWAGNANVALQEGQLGYNIAQGTWDRNEQKARQGYDDQRAYDQSVASAAAANASMGYQRDLDDYNRARDEFWTNQDRQYGILDREATRGYDAATRYGDQMMGAYGAMGNMAVGAGDSRASGTMGAANAWGGYANDIAGTIGGLAMYGAAQPRKPGISGARSYAGAAQTPYAPSAGNMQSYRAPQLASRPVSWG